MTITIITICYNPGLVIRSGVDSVLGQSFRESGGGLEYLIVDGGSTDGTVEWLRELEKNFSEVTVVSEPDDGLYDALNKGVRLATGDVIGFVHADDMLADQEVLQKVADKMKITGADALYGDLQYVREDGAQRKNGKTGKLPNFKLIRHWESGEYHHKNLKWGWMPPHPTFYLRREVYDRAMLDDGNYFDTSFTCAADYDFMMRVLWSLRVEPAYLPEVMVHMRVGGVSNRSVSHILRKSLEDWRAIRRNRVGHIHTLVWKNLGKIRQFWRKG